MGLGFKIVVSTLENFFFQILCDFAVVLILYLTRKNKLVIYPKYHSQIIKFFLLTPFLDNFIWSYVGKLFLGLGFFSVRNNWLLIKLTFIIVISEEDIPRHSVGNWFVAKFHCHATEWNFVFWCQVILIQNIDGQTQEPLRWVFQCKKCIQRNCTVWLKWRANDFTIKTFG